MQESIHHIADDDFDVETKQGNTICRKVYLLSAASDGNERERACTHVITWMYISLSLYIYIYISVSSLSHNYMNVYDYA